MRAITLGEHLRRLLTLPEDRQAFVRHARSVPIREIVRRFWPYARPYRRYFALSVLLIVLVPAVEAAQIWMFKLVIDDVIEPRNLQPLAWIAGVYLGLGVLGGIVAFGNDYLSAWIGESFLLSLRTALFRHVQGLSLDFFERNRLGDIVARLTGDVASIETFVLSGVTRALSYSVRIAIFAGLLFYLRWELALVALVVGPVALAATRYFSRLRKQASREKRRRSGALSAITEESLANVQLVQAYNRQETEVQRFERENRGSADAELASARIKAVFAPLVDLIKVGGALFVIGFGTWELERGRLSLGGLLVFLTYLSRLYSPIHGLSRLGSSVFAASAGAERIIELLDQRPSVVERKDGRLLGWVQGRIEFDRVSFAYADTAADALSGVSFRIEPGATVALVGQSGAGKSTIAKLLLRFYDPDEGTVRLDGIDIRDLRLPTLRSNIALVLQETLVFDGTIRENIAYGAPGAPDGAIIRAAKEADAHEFISAFRDGYDTVIGQRGRRLSGGQRQRIAIARAMIRQAPVLILDEPTTGLDAISSQSILDPLRRLMSGRTTIVITHNLLTVREATSIFVLDQGRIIEAGKHLELIARGGRYAQLYRFYQPRATELIPLWS